MADNDYPAFLDGQTLTSEELNQLRKFLDSRDRLLGRLIGFGINCGLGGTVAGTTLTINPGLAVDQRGEPLLLPAAQTIALPPTPLSGTFPFVEPADGGFSVVLESFEPPEVHTPCADTGCTHHADLHTRAVGLRVVAGRLTGPLFDFANESLLTVEPMRLSLMSVPQGSYATLRGLIATRLKNNGTPLIDTALITKLEGTSMASGDLPGVKGYKAGFINQVLFATLDLLRCRALMAVACDRTTSRPGVVLGWVRLAAGSWTWDCAYRHEWEPPVGLAVGLVGGGCTDPCGIYRDELEALIAGYAPPDPPPPSTGTGTGPGPVVVVCPHGYTMVKGKCLNFILPKKELNPDWKKVWVNPRDPRWNPPRDYRVRQELIATEIYRVDPLEFFGKQTFSTLEALGWRRGLVETAVTDTVTALGGTAHIVTVSTEAELAGIPGFTTGNTFNVGDTVVMVVDALDNVSAFGRVAGAQVAREMGAALPAAAEAANQAVQAVRTIPTMVETAVQERAAGFQALEESIGGLLERAGTLLSEDTIKATVRTAVDDRMKAVDASVGNLQTQINNLYSVKGTVGTPGLSGQRLDQDMSLGITAFADTLSAGLQELVTPENEGRLGRHIKRVHSQAAELRTISAAGEPIAIGDATVKLLSSLRTAVKAAGVDPRTGRAIDVQLTVVRGLLG